MAKKAIIKTIQEVKTGDYIYPVTMAEGVIVDNQKLDTVLDKTLYGTDPIVDEGAGIPLIVADRAIADEYGNNIYETYASKEWVIEENIEPINGGDAFTNYDELSITENTRKITNRKDTEQNWITANPILSRGEIALVIDKDYLKVGDGINNFTNLLKVGGGGTAESEFYNLPLAIIDLTGDSTQEEIMAALGMEYGEFFTLMTNSVGKNLKLQDESEVIIMSQSTVTINDDEVGFISTVTLPYATLYIGIFFSLNNGNFQVYNQILPLTPEAPTDGKQYARQDGEWTEVQDTSTTGLNIIRDFNLDDLISANNVQTQEAFIGAFGDKQEFYNLFFNASEYSTVNIKANHGVDTLPSSFGEYTSNSDVEGFQKVNIELEFYTNNNQYKVQIALDYNSDEGMIFGDYYLKLETKKQYEYDILIETQEQFDNLVNSPTWLGASIVAFRGVFTHSTHLAIPQNTTKLVGLTLNGDNPSINITISNLIGSSIVDLLGYKLITDIDFNLTIDAISSKFIYGIKGDGMLGVFDHVNINTEVNQEISYCAIAVIDKIINSTVKSEYKIESTKTHYGVYYTNVLDNIQVEVIGGGAGGIEKILYASNSQIITNSNRGIACGIIYNGLNIEVKVNGIENGGAFEQCHNLINCGDIEGSVNPRTFNRCTNLIGCHSINEDKSVGFTNCRNVSASTIEARQSLFELTNESAASEVNSAFPYFTDKLNEINQSSIYLIRSNTGYIPSIETKFERFETGEGEEKVVNGYIQGLFILNNNLKRIKISNESGSLKAFVEIIDIGGIPQDIIETNYSDLKTLCNNSALKVGCKYRITDYECTTIQENTRSAGNQFDIIVTALSENTLSEDAKAIQHEGDTYFDDCKLEAWELKYCLENDDKRFAWANTEVSPMVYTNDELWFEHMGIVIIGDIEYNKWYNQEFNYDDGESGEEPGYLISDVSDGINLGTTYSVPSTGFVSIIEAGYSYTEELKLGGKGVIWYMKDEYNNECPYDFKNIQYKVFKIESASQSDLVGQYLSTVPGETRCTGIVASETDFVWAYTFDCLYDDNHIDLTAQVSLLDDPTDDTTWNKVRCHDNSLGQVKVMTGGGGEFRRYSRLGLNCTVFMNTEFICNSNNIGCNSPNISFGNSCYYNYIGDDCYPKAAGKVIMNFIFGSSCYNNKFGNACFSISLGGSCYNNTFSNFCFDNEFGSACHNNTCDNGCCRISLGVSCFGNCFDTECNTISSGRTCRNNKFGGSCCNISLGDFCFDSIFGNSCNNVTFSNDCSQNIFGNSCNNVTFSNDCSQNIFGTGCNFLDLSAHDNLKLYHFDNGIIGAYPNPRLIPQLTANNTELYNVSYASNYDPANPDLENSTDLFIYRACDLGGSSEIIGITYSELVTLKDTSMLSKGQQYRIIDYECTTIQENTRSAGNQFDIIVTALSEDTLSEDAKAIQHDGDTYFDDCKLEAWELKYCLENDDKRFAWANTEVSPMVYTNDELWFEHMGIVIIGDIEYNKWYNQEFNYDDGESGEEPGYLISDVSDGINLGTTYSVPSTGFVSIIEAGYSYTEELKLGGKGVIWYMKDEYNNECPYDFKNIQYKVFKIESAPQSDLVGQYLSTVPGDTQCTEIIASETDCVWAYTFDCLYDGNHIDLTAQVSLLDDLANDTSWDKVRCHDNSLGQVKIRTGGGGEFKRYSRLGLNYITFMNTSFKCFDNKIGSNTMYICAGGSFNQNTIQGNMAGDVGNMGGLSFVFGNGCYSNSFGNGCFRNSFGNDCSSNSFGNDCFHNSFGNGCYNNSFGNDCSSNSFGNNCYSNSFGNDYSSNSFGNECYNNSFGNKCYNNSFGSVCSCNSFDNGCFRNSFGNNYSSNSFGNDCFSNSFGNGCFRNSFGSVCSNNSFGDDCFSNSFGNGCFYNSFGNTCGYNALGNGCIHINLSELDNLKLYKFDNGIKGTNALNKRFIPQLTENNTEQYNVSYASHYDPTNPDLENSTDLKIFKFSESGSSEPIDIEYWDLRKLRDNNELIDGTTYKIIEYNFYSHIHNVSSDFVYFDIYIKALTSDTFCEDIKLLSSCGDYNFTESWEAKYSIDNNNDRFNWTKESVILDINQTQLCFEYDGEVIIGGITYYNYCRADGYTPDNPNGNRNYLVTKDKYLNWDSEFDVPNSDLSSIIEYSLYTPSNFPRGTIYYLKDNDGNECPYDFKNALIDGVYTIQPGSTNNIIKPLIRFHKSTTTQYLNYIKLLEVSNNNTFGEDCSGIIFRSGAINNNFGNNCSSIEFLNTAENNSFGNFCRNIVLSIECENNSFGNNCLHINLGDYCKDNIFENSCEYISILKSCTKNIFQSGCHHIKFGTYFNSNIIGQNCEWLDLRSKSRVNLYQFNGTIKGLPPTPVINPDTEEIEYEEDNSRIIPQLKANNKSAYAINLNEDAEEDMENSTDLLIYPINSLLTTQINHGDLINLINNSELIPGKCYEIIDYETTTSQKNTRSSNNKFNIIVTALTNNSLDETAKVCERENIYETYELLISNVRWNIPNITNYLLDITNYTTEEITNIITTVQSGTSVDIIENLIFPENAELYYNALNGMGAVAKITGSYIQNDYFKDSELNSWEIKYDIFGSDKRFAWSTGEKGIVVLNTIDGYLPFKFVEHVTDDKGANQYIWYNSDSSSGIEAGFVMTRDEVVDGSSKFVYGKDGGDDDRAGAVMNIIYNKGVIWFMKDEYNNECPYDFKNIQYKVFKIESAPQSDLVGQYLSTVPGDTQCTEIIASETDCVWAYTFDCLYDGNHIDLTAQVSLLYDPTDDSTWDKVRCHDNSLGQVKIMTGGGYEFRRYSRLGLNFIVFMNTGFACFCNKIGCNYFGMGFGNNCVSNEFADTAEMPNYGGSYKGLNFIFGNDCYYNSFGSGCAYISTGDGFCNNSFGESCSYNSFGESCSYNSFGNDCSSNSFGNDCSNNSFGNNCHNNSFGNNCHNNSFGNTCYYNALGNDCGYNALGNGCYDNSFGNDCYSNSFGSVCYSNSFGNECYHNSFGNECYNNSFGSVCSCNSFGNGCFYNSFGNTCGYNALGNGCIHINLSELDNLKLYKFDNGIKGTNASNKRFIPQLTESNTEQYNVSYASHYDPTNPDLENSTDLDVYTSTFIGGSYIATNQEINDLL